MHKKFILGLALGVVMIMPAMASKEADTVIRNAIQSGSYVVDFSSICSNQNLSKEQKALTQELAYRIHDELISRLAAIGNLKGSINGNARLPSERRLASSLKEYEDFLSRALQKNRTLILQNCRGVRLPNLNTL